ncbi:hypothetical protein ABPG75_003571 [Micractinium tetrahymenae]
MTPALAVASLDSLPDELCNSAPQLLRCIGASFDGTSRGAAQLSAFCAWFLRHAVAHVQLLSLEVETAGSGAHAGTAEKLAAATAAVLALCSRASSLTALRLDGQLGQPAIWASGMRGLRRLHVSASFRQAWDPPPGTLSGLQELALSGMLVDPPIPSLPASLTRLHLDFEDAEVDNLPAYVTALTRLHTLGLRWAGSGLSALGSKLTSLRRLSLVKCTEWPPGLSQLTGLQALEAEGTELLDDEAASAAAMGSAIPQLRHLTALALEVPSDQEEALVPSLASMTGLRCCAWLSYSVPVPPGPWLGGLERLAATAEQVAPLAPTLAIVAPRLQTLALYCSGLEHAAPVCRRWRQLCSAAPQVLRCIAATFDGSEQSAERLGAFCDWFTRRAAPHVQLLRLSVGWAEPGAPPGTAEKLAAGAAAVLVACSVASSLTALRLDGQLGQPAIWAGSMRGLRRLHINSGFSQAWDAPACAFSGLHELAVSGSLAGRLPAPLPASLTRLHLDFSKTLADHVPASVTALSQLHTLASMRGLRLAEGGFSALSKLTHPAPPVAAAAEAFSHLRQLSSLAIDVPEDGSAALVPALTATNTLRSCAWLSRHVPVPAGPWLAGLERLVACIEQAAAMVSALADESAAPRLDTLGLFCCTYDGGVAVLHALLHRLLPAPRLPALRRLVVGGSESSVGCCAPALLSMQRVAPRVAVECTPDVALLKAFLVRRGWEAVPSPDLM